MSLFWEALTAPLTPINPWFYEGLYDSTQDDTTFEYVRDHMVPMSGWLFTSAVYAYQTGKVVSPFAALTRGFSVINYITPPAVKLVALTGIAAHHNLTAPPPPEYDHPSTPWYLSVAQGITGGVGVGTWSP